MILPGVTASGRQVAPSVRTDAATNVVVSGGTLASATLNGTVLRAENSDNSVVYRWGTSSTLSSYSTTSATVVSQGSTNQVVPVTLTGLSDGTVYYFRIVSTNTGGTSLGDILTFTTPINAPAVTTGSGSDGTATPTASTSNPSNYAKNTATLGGTFTANTAYIQYSSFSNFAVPSSTSSSTTSPISVGVSDLSALTTYYCRIIASNTSLTLNVAGTVNPNNRSTTVLFRYANNPSFTGSSTISAGTFTGTTNQSATASITGLSAGTWYFRIEATSVGGTSIGGTSSGVALSTKTTTGDTKQFTTYTDRSQTFSTVTESGVWYYPSIPSGGAAVTSISVYCIGAGGGGGRSINGYGAGGGGGGSSNSGALTVSNNNATVVVGRGGTGQGRVTGYSNNGQASSVTIGGQSITAAGGTVGGSDLSCDGGSSTFSGGAKYVDNTYGIYNGGGGGGRTGKGGDAGTNSAGVGGFGVSGQMGGGGGAGIVSVYLGGTTYYTGSGTDGGGSGGANADGGDATNYGGGGGGSVNGRGGNGYQGLVTISWVGP